MYEVRSQTREGIALTHARGEWRDCWTVATGLSRSADTYDARPAYARVEIWQAGSDLPVFAVDARAIGAMATDRAGGL